MDVRLAQLLSEERKEGERRDEGCERRKENVLHGEKSGKRGGARVGPTREGTGLRRDEVIPVLDSSDEGEVGRECGKGSDVVVGSKGVMSPGGEDGRAPRVELLLEREERKGRRIRRRGSDGDDGERREGRDGLEGLRRLQGEGREGRRRRKHGREVMGCDEVGGKGYPEAKGVRRESMRSSRRRRLERLEEEGKGGARGVAGKGDELTEDLRKRLARQVDHCEWDERQDEGDLTETDSSMERWMVADEGGGEGEEEEVGGALCANCVSTGKAECFSGSVLPWHRRLLSEFISL